MLLSFALPEHDRKLIPEGRLTGPMPWVIAIMIFLTLLSAAAGILLLDGARRGGDDLARQVTVQILEADPVRRGQQGAAVAARLRAMPDIAGVQIVRDSELRALLEPWLGDAVADADIPVPALIDTIFRTPPSAGRLQTLERQLRPLSPGLKIDSHMAWLAPYFGLVRALLLLAAGIFVLLLLATSATVILAVKSALNTHRGTIEIMHMMGGTDVQAARLFQRRVALDALLGGVMGFAVAAAVLLILGGRFAELQTGLLAAASFPAYGWLILAILPLAVTGIAMLMARWTVLVALRKIL